MDVTLGKKSPWKKEHDRYLLKRVIQGRTPYENIKSDGKKYRDGGEGNWGGGHTFSFKEIKRKIFR